MIIYINKKKYKISERLYIYELIEDLINLGHISGEYKMCLNYKRKVDVRKRVSDILLENDEIEVI